MIDRARQERSDTTGTLPTCTVQRNILEKRLMFTQGFVLWVFTPKDTQSGTIICLVAKTEMRRLILLSWVLSNFRLEPHVVVKEVTRQTSSWPAPVISRTPRRCLETQRWLQDPTTVFQEKVQDPLSNHHVSFITHNTSTGVNLLCLETLEALPCSRPFNS